MVSLKNTLGLALTALLAQQAYSQDFAESMQSMGKNAVEGYMQPFATGIGVGMNSQWAYSAKTMSFLGLPVGFNLYIGYPVVTVDKSMKTFDFKGSIPAAAIMEEVGMPEGTSLGEMVDFVNDATGKEYDADDMSTVDVEIDDVPTIYGSKKGKRVTLEDALSGNTELLSLIRDYDSLATIANEVTADSIPTFGQGLDEEVTMPFRGLDVPIAPALPPIGGTIAISKIPVLNNITVGMRYVPTLGNDDLGEVGMFGFMVQHEITPHIPVFSKVPFVHMAAYYGYNSFFIEAKDIAKVESINHIGMFLVSLDAKFLVGLGVYGGIGFEKSTLSVEVEDLEVEGMPTVEGFSLDVDGENTLRTQLGARISLAIFDVYADANWGSTTTYNFGLAIGLNGL